MGCTLKSGYRARTDAPSPARHNQNSQWMATHIDLIRDTKIRYLLIPGSHDSGTYKIPPQSLLYELTCTQHVSIDSQLTSGIRYIDLRYGPGSPHPTDIHILHHSAKSITLHEALSQISTFISQNP